MVGFSHGFNDIFHVYAAHPEGTPSMRDIAFNRASDCHSNLIRFQCDWPLVQYDSESVYHWTIPGYFDWDATRTACLQRNMKVLPIITGVPTAWVPRADRTPCNFAAVPGSASEDANIPWYPSTAASQAKFGQYAVEVLKFFDQCGTIDAIEVWNEPNGGATYIPFWVYPQIVAAVVNAVAAANAANQFSHPMRVVAGALVMDQDDVWKTYLSYFDSLALDFDVSIHPYDTKDHPTLDWDEAADAVVDRVSYLYNQAAAQTVRNLWVTESGASSRSPYGQQGQARALKRLYGSSGFFQGRARCKAALVHKLRGSDNLSGFKAFPVCMDDAPWTPKTAYYDLQSAWL